MVLINNNLLISNNKSTKSCKHQISLQNKVTLGIKSIKHIFFFLIQNKKYFKNNIYSKTVVFRKRYCNLSVIIRF